MAMPTEIVGLLRSTLTLTWPSGHVSTYPARALRLACRCANCVEEMSGAPLIDPQKIPEAIRARSIQLVGQYAMTVEWSDGHTTGIYNFRDLRANCPCAECKQLRDGGSTLAE